jgi:hypothetical protein
MKNQVLHSIPANLTNVLMKGLVAWLCIIGAETIHGIARRLFLEPLVGDLRARQISVFVGSTLILAITFIFFRWLDASGTPHYFLTGLMWVTLTVAFEVLLGRFVLGVSWEQIASDYNIANGGLMVVGLLIMLFAPYIIAKLTNGI